ncbi:MAG: TetR/AcrR family transcriptional regulator [Betaproteobacteria bacterium]|nr:TetR/AcrR family transcriptional regulator [Betaproteobacteria bacterium]
MNQKVQAATETKSDTTRQRLMVAARQLFSKFGVDGVSVRDIVAAAGARNGASIHYYFGTKEALIQELVAEGAKLINQRRNGMLDAAESSGRAPSLREIVKILVESSFPKTASEMQDREGYLRFITVLQLTHRKLFIAALQNRWNSGYMRCLDHFRRALAPMAPAIVEQRLRLMALYLGATLSSREAALEGKEIGKSPRLWGAAFDLDNLVDTVCGLLQQPPAPETLSRQ